MFWPKMYRTLTGTDGLPPLSTVASMRRSSAVNFSTRANVSTHRRVSFSQDDSNYFAQSNTRSDNSREVNENNERCTVETAISPEDTGVREQSPINRVTESGMQSILVEPGRATHPEPGTPSPEAKRVGLSEPGMQMYSKAREQVQVEPGVPVPVEAGIQGYSETGIQSQAGRHVHAEPGGPVGIQAHSEPGMHTKAEPGTYSDAARQVQGEPGAPVLVEGRTQTHAEPRVSRPLSSETGKPVQQGQQDPGMTYPAAAKPEMSSSELGAPVSKLALPDRTDDGARE
jgi:hypothetical protein